MPDLQRLKKKFEDWAEGGLCCGRAGDYITELRNELDMHVAALDALEHRLFGDVGRRSRDEMEAQAERLAAREESLTAHAVSLLLGATAGSDWWYDGRDIFHKPEGMNLDQIVIPLPETWHESQRVGDGDALLVTGAVNLVRSLADVGSE